MKRPLNLIVYPVLIVAIASGASIAAAQSGTKSGGSRVAKREPVKLNPEQKQAAELKPSPLVADLVAPRVPLAMEGFDPVLLKDTKQLSQGSEAIADLYDGNIYRFAGQGEKNRFAANRDAYTPAFGGMSVVAWKDEKKRVPGTVKQYVVFSDRLFLFSTAAEKDKFTAAPADYLDADLVLQGFSPVSLVDKEELRKGSREFQVIYDGRRSWLADAEELKKYRENPGKYYPTLGGLDPVALFEGKVETGIPKFSVVYKNRLYCMATAATRDKFLANAGPYSDLDVAMEGTCPVTLADSRQKEPGHYGISAILLGQRYLFASEEHRVRFLESPAKFVSTSGR